MNLRSLWIVMLVLAHTPGVQANPTVTSKPAPAQAIHTPAAVPVQKTERVASDKRRIIGILDVRVEGVPKEIAAQFEHDLEKQLDSHAYWLATKSRVQEMMANSTRWTEGCVVGSCLAEVRTQTSAEIVMLATITGADNTFGYVVTLVRTDNGRWLSQKSERCDVCTVDEVLSSATLAAVKLLAAVPDVLPDVTSTNAATARNGSTHTATLEATTRRHRRISIATVLTGIVVAGVGSALFFTDNHRPYALATATAGGGLLLAGMFSLNF